MHGPPYENDTAAQKSLYQRPCFDIRTTRYQNQAISILGPPAPIFGPRGSKILAVASVLANL